MSPSPFRILHYPVFSLPKPIPSDEQLSAASDSTQGVPLSNPADPTPQNSTSESESAPLVPNRPLMRPVSRPQPPPTPPAKSATSPVAPKPTAATAQKVELISSMPTPTEEELLAEQAAMRQQPIPPPSEPKQYRAIGLVRGQYTPSEEQFTRGELKTADGTMVEAVLLGRVMSLVRNHLDLAENHLWVVYPRTREMQENLHVQIVGVWEPEKLSKAKDEEDSESESADSAAEEPTEEDHSPGYEDDYFSIRGEVVFYSEEDKQVVVKIQQAARKSSSKAKAFKLKLEGALSSPKTLGYFWELHVKRMNAALTITEGKAIGLVPPRKKTGDELKRERRPFRGSRDSRPGAPRGAGAGSSAPPVRREPPPKPVKRREPGSEG